MSRRSRLCLILVAALLATGTAAPVLAQFSAYCYITDLKVNALSNGVQIQVKADGVLRWRWEGQEPDRWRVTELAIRFQNARLGLEKTLYDVSQEPVSTVTLTVPQDAIDGRGVVLTATMTEPSRVDVALSEDQQTALITVRGSRTVERATNGATAVKQAKTGSIEVRAHDGLLDVQAMKADIHKVVAEVALKGNISVAVDDKVKHDVSINVHDQKPLDVIRGLAAGYGLALSAVGDVHMLSDGVPTDLPSYRRSGTASFPMKYLKARDAASLLPTFLFKYVHDNPEQNAVVVTAPTQMLDKIAKDLKAVDIAPPMIMVECAVVELAGSSDLDRKFQWEYRSGRVIAGSDSSSGEVQFEQRAAGAPSALASAVSGTAMLRAWLQALITEGQAEVRAHPTMAAVNGKEAEIFVGAQRFIKLSYLQSGYVTERIETIPVGVKLKVKPWTGGGDEITTDVEVEVSNISAIDPETGLPRLGTRRATTTLRTRAGETIVIGGLSQSQEEVTRRRIPLLGDIPLIGQLFRSTSTRTRNTEMVLLIRPRLLDENGRLPAEEDLAIREQFLQPGNLGCAEPNPDDRPEFCPIPEGDT